MSFKSMLCSVLLLSSAMTVSACTPEPVIVKEAVHIDHISPNLPESTKLSHISWKVHNRATADKYFAANKKSVLFALPKDQAVKLGQNQAEQLRYIMQLRAVVDFYQQQNKTTEIQK